MPMQSFRTLADVTIIVIRTLNSKHTDSFIKCEYCLLAKTEQFVIRPNYTMYFQQMLLSTFISNIKDGLHRLTRAHSPFSCAMDK